MLIKACQGNTRIEKVQCVGNMYGREWRFGILIIKPAYYITILLCVFVGVVVLSRV